MSNTGTSRLPVRAYLDALEHTLRLGNATEPSYYPHLQAFLQALAPDITATTNPKRIACGAPDFAISHSDHPWPSHKRLYRGQGARCLTGHAIEKSDQLQRYLTLPNLLLTDFLTFRWYVDGELRQEVRLGQLDTAGRLRPARVAEREQASRATTRLPRPCAGAGQRCGVSWRKRLARLTHLIRDTIIRALERDDASDLLRDLRQAFEQTLVPDQSAEEFADMFAQTLAYGLFAARCNHSAPAPFQRLSAAAEIPKTNPFLPPALRHDYRHRVGR